MKTETYELFLNASAETIVNSISDELNKRNESPFWADKVVPFSKAVLSVLVPLRDKGLLFNPEGMPIEKLTPELFLQLQDFLSLKMLAFTIQKSNLSGKLERTKLSSDNCEKYEEIDLQSLGDYLARYTVNLEDEMLDFPISNYNLHQGVTNVIKSLL